MIHDNGVKWSGLDSAEATAITLEAPQYAAHSFIHWFTAQVARRGEACALRCGEHSMTYLGLQRESNRVARLLIERGLKPGDAVALLLPRCIEAVVAMLAVQKAGGFFVPVDPALPDERIGYLLSDCGARLVLSRPDVQAARRVPAEQLLPIEQQAQFGEAELFEAVVPQADDRIYVIYTSGSTGKPKGAINFHAGVVNLYRWFAQELSLNADCRSLILGSLSFDLYHKGIFAPLLAGGCVVLDDSPVFDAERLRATIEREGITLLCATPSAFHALIEDLDDAARRQLASLQVVSLGGEAVLKPRLRPWLLHPQCRTRLINTYGPTECADIQSYHWVSREDLEGEPSVPIGRAIPGCALYVLDDALEPVPPGTAGKLWLGGICVGGGYLNLPGKTAEAFRADPFRPGATMYCTGDLAAWRGAPEQGGVLEYRGRADRQVKVRGYRIELDEVEAHLSALPQVQECAAVAPADAEGERHIHAYVRLARGQAQDSAALRRALAQTLPDYALPVAWSFLDAFPYNNSGKIDRNALPAAAPVAAVDGGAGATLEQKIAALWRELIGCPSIDEDAPFMEQGGTSLLTVRFLSRLARLAGVKVPVAEFFAAPTVRGFAAFLRARHPQAVRQWTGEEPGTAQTQSRRRQRRVPPAMPMAVVGMACRVPGAEDVETLWEHIRSGRDLLCREGAGEGGAVKVSGWIEDAEGFDHGFFRYTPREAAVTDPQQRILLECAWHALEHAGIDPARSAASIGVYAGVAANSYLTRNLAGHAEFRDYGMDYASIGNDKDFCATRIAYKLDLHGPALGVQTGCSSSGVALHTACLALAAGDCDVAIVGGSALPWRFRDGHQYVEDGPFSRDGRVRAFDASASGMVMSGGAVCVVLKRLDDALADGDTIHSVIRATALNNDGSAKAAFTAPNGEAQTEVIRLALQRAGLSAEQIGLVEAHGTGTPIGDPIEITALTRAYRQDTQKQGWCALGSVKGNIGHLDAGAACAGLVKLSLALSHGVVPPQPHFEKPNPECHLEGSPFYVPTGEQPWPEGQVRRAAMSSFGFGGTNFHAVVEQPPQLPGVERAAARRWQVLRLSAKTPQALQRQAERLAQWRKTHPQASLADAAWTLDTGRARMAERGVIVACDGIEPARLLRGRTLNAVDGTVWMFPGQGTQYAGMGERLYREEPVFREALDRCAELLREPLGADLRELMFARGEAAAARLCNTAVAQPAIFSFSYALARLWQSRGLQPRALLGHSIGEFVAATLAGVFSLEQVLPLIALRGALMAAQAPGSMLAVREEEGVLRGLLPPALDFAAVNAPRLCVVSGPTPAIEAFKAVLEKRGIASSLLRTSHAFHSAMMEPALEPFAAAVARCELRAPQIPLVSTVTGEPLGDAQARDPQYWAQQLRRPVRFADAARALAQVPGRVFLEVGPGQSLSTALRQIAAGMQVEAVASQAPSGSGAVDECEHLETALGRLWLAGIELEPDAAAQGRRIALPGYPFERTRHWIEPAAAGAVSGPALTTESPGAESSRDSGNQPDRLSALLTRCSGIALGAQDWDRSFLDLGFDSLLLTQVAAQIKQAYGVELRFRTLLRELSTPRALAEHLDAQAVSAAPVMAGLEQPEPAVAAARSAVDPPCAGARLGLDAEGNPAWFVPGGHNGAYVQVGE